MPEPPMRLPKDNIAKLLKSIETTMQQGTLIREELSQNFGKGPWDITWEVKAAVEALHIFGSRWTTEILTTLYIAGPRRFNQLKTLLSGISSRTLSDKLQLLVEENLVDRIVVDGPPVKVSYALSQHGRDCGILLSPLVAHLKMHLGSIKKQ